MTPQDENTACPCGVRNCQYYGVCHCGCGAKTGTVKKSIFRQKRFKGEPSRYLAGHQFIEKRPDLSGAAPFKINGTYCRLIPLTRGQYSIVDAADYERLSAYGWAARWARQTRTFYAVRNEKIDGKMRVVLMHRQILGLAFRDRRQGDHVDRNTLNNTGANLRIASNTQNQYNRGKHPLNSSGYKGVTKKGARWVARITVDGRKIHLGHFHTPEEAHAAYCVAAWKLHGEFARTA